MGSRSPTQRRLRYDESQRPAGESLSYFLREWGARVYRKSRFFMLSYGCMKKENIEQKERKEIKKRVRRIFKKYEEMFIALSK